jgi:hypothetical protein
MCFVGKHPYFRYMMDKITDFPQYRKLSNGKTFYKIVDERNFEELQLMGTRVLHYNTTAEQYPEILRIGDMLSLEPPYQLSTKEEYNAVQNV